MFTYDDFISKVNELGFVANSNMLAGFPQVSDFSHESQWWTGDPETDPWMWQARSAREKKLVYGSFYRGKRGFISPEWFSVYYNAFHPTLTVGERHAEGKLGKYELQVWDLFAKENRILGTHEIRRLLGVTPKTGANSVDTAITNLCMTCDLVVAGDTDMLDKDGVPYNKSISYDLLENWIPSGWINPASQVDPLQALEKINNQLHKISGIDVSALTKIFGKQAKLNGIKANKA